MPGNIGHYNCILDILFYKWRIKKPIEVERIFFHCATLPDFTILLLYNFTTSRFCTSLLYNFTPKKVDNCLPTLPCVYPELLYRRRLDTSSLLGHPYFLLDAQEDASRTSATTATTGTMRRRFENAFILLIDFFTNYKTTAIDL